MSDKPKKSNKKTLYTNPSVLIMCFNSFAVSLGYGLVQPFVMFYVLALEGELTQPPASDYVLPEHIIAEYAIILGLMMTSFMTTRTLLARYWGGLSDRIGRKPIIVWGLVGYVLFMAILGLSRNWVDFLIIRLCMGSVSAAVWPVGQATLIDIIGEESRGEGMGLYNFSMTIGWISGPGIGGLLYNLCRDTLQLSVPAVFRVPYFIAAIIILPAPVLTYLILKEPTKAPMPPLSEDMLSKKPEAKTSGLKPSNGAESLNPHTKKMINTLYLMAVMNGLAQGIAMPIYTLFIIARITTDVATIGFIVTGAGGVGLLMNIPAGRLSDKYGRKNLALWSGVVSRGAMAALPHTQTVTQTSVAYFARSGAFNISQPIMSAIQGDIVPPRIRGHIFGTFQAFNNAGGVLGPLVGSWLFSVTSLMQWQIGSTKWFLDGIVLPFWLAAIMGLIGLAFFAKNITETRHFK